MSKEKFDINEELSKLVRSRAYLKGRLTNTAQYVTSQSNLKTITSAQKLEFQLRLDRCQDLFREFDRVQTQIESLSGDEEFMNEQITLRTESEDKFITVIAGLKDTINKHCNTVKNESETCCSHFESLNSIKLPTIQLPTFDGSYLKWLEYRDTFQSLIHSNRSIPDINKYHYLRSSLEGGALEVLKSLEFTSDNYSVAWDLLRSRYDNKKILITNHLKALFNFTPLDRESHKSLRYLVDYVSKNLRALNTLGQKTDYWDVLIIYMISSKLDSVTYMKWEEFRNNLSDIPSLEEFYTFIRNRADILEATATVAVGDRGVCFNRSKNNFNNKSQTINLPYNINNNKETKGSNSFVTSVENVCDLLCLYCNQQGHRIYDCAKFKQLDVSNRIKEVSRLNVCTNCLREGHVAKRCRLRGLCRTCKYNHNSLLHINKSQNNTNKEVSLTVNSHSPDPLPPVALSAVCTNQVLLCTAVIKVFKESSSEAHLVRALLDTGSQSSFLTENLRNKLQLTTITTKPLRISGINNLSFNITQRCVINIQSCNKSYTKQIHCHVVPKITGTLPSTPVDVLNLNIPHNVELADPQFHRPAEIDLLLGADVFWELIGLKRISLGVGKPILQDSQFGWLISGPLSYNSVPNSNHVICNFNREINESLKRFWELEELGSKGSIVLSPEEKLCESHFLENVSRLPNGQFSVKMPLKEIPEEALGDSYYQAKRRFLNLEKKLQKQPDIKKRYTEFIEEYRNLGHLNEIVKPKFGYYLPHHAVLREKSETTKLRVVFDASAKTTSGKSLNDIQLVGPVVQDDLLSILLRFRCHKYVFTGDIQKMYRQVEIDPSQRHLQLILWRGDGAVSQLDSSKDTAKSRALSKAPPIKIFQLNTVTYGTASAPYLSTRCLLQLARECLEPVISNTIQHDIYMDDVNTGAQFKSELKRLYDGVKAVLTSAGFPLHKVRSNCPDIIGDEITSKSLELNKQFSVLGLNWSPIADTLHFSVNISLSERITKRSIISMTCKIFDPLGLLCACIIKAKLILQSLWYEKLDWDDPVPAHIVKVWMDIAKGLPILSDINIPRYVLCDSVSEVELHCFVDASHKAYGACVYLRSTDDKNDVVVRLLCAKSRVAPLKAMTTPRLELCGTLLGARLATKVLESIRFPIHKKVLWCDSTVVLGWLKTPPKSLKSFVANRVAEINDLTRDFLRRHVPTEMNPADLASRGVDPQRLLREPLWWEGPSFLKEGSSAWPSQPYNSISMDLPELKSLVQIEHVDDKSKLSFVVYFGKFSNFNRLKRAFAYVLRFIHNLKNKNSKLSGCLQIDEINNSLEALIKLCQRDTFSDELKTLNRGDHLHKKSKLLPLNPFIDGRGILRVGGRIGNSTFTYNKKHPIILDTKHKFTILLMQYEHRRLFHAGPQLLLSSIREDYWPVGGRQLSRKVLKSCVICTRYRGKCVPPLMGNLPSVRTNATFPFCASGADFAGPFMISSKKGRGNRTTKCYLCLFVCLNTRALHLELVSDLSTQAFVLCLRRFISRRGKPHTIYCDNGTNFVGANNELGRILRSCHDSVIDFANNEGIQFKFSPAYSPHFGGIWEAGVKAAKYHLKRIVGNHSLTFEELGTLFVQIEAILNSRPLSPMSSDPLDLNPLTPGHFLIGRPLMSLPSLPADDSKPKYHLIEKIRREFWNRWHKEFLAELQHRTKWRVNSVNPKIGDMVIIKEENLPPQRWRLGRVSGLHAGSDNVCRVVDIYTSRGTIRRAIHNIVRLPNDEEMLES